MTLDQEFEVFEAVRKRRPVGFWFRDFYIKYEPQMSKRAPGARVIIGSVLPKDRREIDDVVERLADFAIFIDKDSAYRQEVINGWHCFVFETTRVCLNR